MILEIAPTERNILELQYAKQQSAPWRPTSFRLNFHSDCLDGDQTYVKLEIKDNTLIAARATGGRAWLSLNIVKSIRVFWQQADPGPCPF